MIELPDDELDKLFRKSSEELDPTYEPDDWNDLRKRLDQQDGRNPAGWWRKWWPLGVLALLIPVGILLYRFAGENGGKGEGRKVKSEVVGGEKSGAKKDEGTESGVTVDGGVTRDGGESGIADSERLRKGAEGTREENASLDNENRLADNGNEVAVGSQKDIKNKLRASGKETGKSSSKSDLNAAAVNGRKLLPRSRSKAGGVYLEPNRSKVEGGDGALSINTKTPRRETAKATVSQAGNEPATRPDGNRASDAITEEQNAAADKERAATSAGEPVTASAEAYRTLISAAALSGKGLTWSALVLPGISNPVQEIAEPPKPGRPSMSADDQPLVAVRFGYSPDLSTVGLKNFSKPGTSVSLLVEYSVLPRLFLQSGAVWSRKDYYAPSDAYKLPKIPHVYLSPMTGIDGVCKVLEVPINLRYDITSGQRSRWFAGAGFSSYHMNSEKYKYNYVNPNDPNAIKYPDWSGKTGWYWFSHANVSAGYEYRISRKLSLLAEPSIRVPLKRVGYGNVNLITTGIWLSVRYTPVFK